MALFSAFKAELFRIRRRFSFVAFLAVIFAICLGVVLLHGETRAGAVEYPPAYAAFVNRMGPEMLPNTFAFFFYYYEAPFHFLMALSTVFLVSGVFSQNYETGMLRTLLVHGMPRRRYLVCHIAADFVVLLGGWTLGMVLIAALGLVFDYMWWGRLVWDSSCWGVMARMGIGYSSQQMIVVGFTLLGVILSRQMLFGVIGGMVGPVITALTGSPFVAWWLSSRPFLSFLAAAHKTVLDMELSLFDPRYIGALLVLWVFARGMMAVNLWLFSRQEIK